MGSGTRQLATPARQVLPSPAGSPRIIGRPGEAQKKGNPKAIGCLTVLVLVVIVVILVVALGGSSGTTYSVRVVSATPTSNQELAVVWSVTNTGKSAGKPTCTVNANSPGYADTGVDVATAVNNLSPGQTGIYHDVITITNNGPRTTSFPRAFKVSCS